MKKISTILVLAVMLGLSSAFITTVNAASSWGDLNLKSDLGLRIQNVKSETTNNTLTQQLRFRLGGDKQINKESSVHFGIAADNTANPRTSYFTLSNFSNPSVTLEYAYLQYEPGKNTLVRVGKNKNLIWTTSDFLWDEDIHTDGVQATHKFNIDKGHNIVVGGGWLFLQNTTTQSDPSIFYIQPVYSAPINDALHHKLGLTYYSINNVRNKAMAWTTGSNSTTAGLLSNDYRPWVISYSVYAPKVDYFRSAGLFAEYVNNSAVSTNAAGYTVGVKVGDTKIRRNGQWNATVSYRRLEADAWLDTFADIDAYGGMTNAQGIELELNYGIAKNINGKIDFYSMNVINGTSNNQQVIQGDLEIKL